jgi:hypothetical protein
VKVAEIEIDPFHIKFYSQTSTKIRRYPGTAFGLPNHHHHHLPKAGSQMTAVRPDVRPIAIDSSPARTLNRTCRVRIMRPTLSAPTKGLGPAPRGGWLVGPMGLTRVTAMIAWSGVGLVGRRRLRVLISGNQARLYDDKKGSAVFLRAAWATHQAQAGADGTPSE